MNLKLRISMPGDHAAGNRQIIYRRPLLLLAIIQPAGCNKQINLFLYSLPSCIIHIARGVFNICPEYFQKLQRAFATSFVTWLAQSQNELQYGMSLTGRPLYRNTHNHIFWG